jgi:hypothetical protein
MWLTGLVLAFVSINVSSSFINYQMSFMQRTNSGVIIFILNARCNVVEKIKLLVVKMKQVSSILPAKLFTKIGLHFSRTIPYRTCVEPSTSYPNPPQARVSSEQHQIHLL